MGFAILIIMTIILGAVSGIMGDDSVVTTIVFGIFVFILLCYGGYKTDMWYYKQVAREVMTEMKDSGVVEVKKTKDTTARRPQLGVQSANYVCDICEKPFVGTEKNAFQKSDGTLKYFCDNCLKSGN